jgi:hypothetical protein
MNDRLRSRAIGNIADDFDAVVTNNNFAAIARDIARFHLRDLPGRRYHREKRVFAVPRVTLDVEAVALEDLRPFGRPTMPPSPMHQSRYQGQRS